MSKLLSRLKPFCVILTLGVGACGVARMLGSEKTSGRLFSHKLHIQDQQLECATCHTRAEKEDQAGMPTSLKKCMVCHEGEDEKKPDDRKLAALLGRSRVDERHRPPEDVKFSHRRHVAEAKVSCTECHRGIESSAGITDEVSLDMEACMDCHTRKSASNDCSTCHTTTRTDVPPPNHRLNWKQNHGPVMRTADDGRYENRCTLCHTEESCSTCHQDEPPKSHTNFWRLKGHGMAAGVDRTACATCHREDFCDRCHTRRRRSATSLRGAVPARTTARTAMFRRRPPRPACSATRI